MSSTYVVDNEGIGGGPFLTMTIDQTANMDFSQDDIDGNLTACAITDNNEVSMGAAGNKLFGKVVWVSTEKIEGTIIPLNCAVQARGVARFYYLSPAPVLNSMVELAGGGKVRVASADADIGAGGHLARGQVIAVDTTNMTCDVWLG